MLRKRKHPKGKSIAMSFMRDCEFAAMEKESG